MLPFISSIRAVSEFDTEALEKSEHKQVRATGCLGVARAREVKVSIAAYIKSCLADNLSARF